MFRADAKYALLNLVYSLRFIDRFEDHARPTAVADTQILTGDAQMTRSLIKRISPPADSLIEAYLGASARARTEPSDLMQRNLDGTPDRIETLVSESILLHLSWFEETHFPFAGLSVHTTPKRNFHSPWSNNLLDLHHYTREILLNYGLMHLWAQFFDKAYDCPEIDLCRIEEKWKKARMGFIKTNCVLDNLGDWTQHLSPEYVDEVIRLQRLIQMRAENQTV